MLVQSVDDVREKREEYSGLDPTFAGTREDNLIEVCILPQPLLAFCSFSNGYLQGCIEAIDEGDAEKFATACSEFDEITKLDSWQTTMLLRAKKGIDDPEADGGEDDDIC
eukprot:SAG11_NODE_177_length_13334_cov_9.614280_5_plen_110_part_00